MGEASEHNANANGKARTKNASVKRMSEASERNANTNGKQTEQKMRNANANGKTTRVKNTSVMPSTASRWLAGCDWKFD
jgi:hypothetical protein